MTYEEYLQFEKDHEALVQKAERTNNPNDSRIARNSFRNLLKIREENIEFYLKRTQSK